MGCLISKSYGTISPNELVINSKTIPLRRIPKMLHFKSIIPSEFNFEIQITSDGQYFLHQSNKEIKYNYTPNKKRWTISQLQSMNYPSFDDGYRVTIGIKEYEALCKYEHLLVPYDEVPEIDNLV
jgi:hypothetical protein